MHSYQADKIVCVDKGDWDKGCSHESIMDFPKTLERKNAKKSGKRAVIPKKVVTLSRFNP